MRKTEINCLFKISQFLLVWFFNFLYNIESILCLTNRWILSMFLSHHILICIFQIYIMSVKSKLRLHIITSVSTSIILYAFMFIFHSISALTVNSHGCLDKYVWFHFLYFFLFLKITLFFSHLTSFSLSLFAFISFFYSHFDYVLFIHHSIFFFFFLVSISFNSIPLLIMIISSYSSYP